MAIDLSAITLTELRYAIAVADHRHFGRAARECSVTQPTLSAQVAKLERTLGATLFERSPKAVHPTPLGEAVVAQARLVIDAAAKVVELVESRKEPLSGPLRLGVIPTLSPYLLPWLVPHLRRAYPRLELVFRELKTADVEDELASHRLDCGVLALPVDAHGIVSVELFDEPFLWLIPAGHRHAARAQVREADLAGERVLLLDEGHCLREQALSICAAARRGRAGEDAAGGGADFRATSIETLRHMVSAGMGTTLLPALALEGRPTPGTVALPFAPPAPSRRMALCWRRTHPRAADFRALAAFVRENLPGALSPAREPAVRGRARGSSARRTPLP